MLYDAARITISRLGVRAGTTASLWSSGTHMAALHGGSGFGTILCVAAGSDFGDAR